MVTVQHRDRVHDTVINSADQTVNDTTVLVNATEMVTDLEANQTYRFIIHVMLNSSAVADMKLGWSVPSGTTMQWTAGLNLTAINVQDETGIQPIAGGGSAQGLAFAGEVRVGGTAGKLQLQFAQNTQEVSNTILLQGTWIMIWRQN